MRIKLNWGFGIATAYILFASSMVLFAITAFKQNNDLVTPKYYDDAVNYQQKINAQKNALDISSRLDIEYLAPKKEIILSSSSKNKSIEGKLFFYKPDRAGDDFQVSFSMGDDGVEIIPLKDAMRGYWKIQASWSVDGKDCYTEKNILIK